MTDVEIEQIRKIIVDLKKMRKKRKEECALAREKFGAGETSSIEFRQMIEHAFDTYDKSTELSRYRKLLSIANEYSEVDSTVQQVYREVMHPDILNTAPMAIFQITWDSKDSEKFDNDALRTDLFKLLLLVNSEMFFYQPTKSTLVFESEKGFVFWQVKLQSFIHRMYFTFCEVSDNSFIEEPRTDIDVKALKEQVLQRIYLQKEVRKEILGVINSNETA